MYKELLHINNKGQRLEQSFHKRNIQMANKHEISLVSRKCNFKTQLTGTTPRILKLNFLKNIILSSEKQNLSYPFDGNKNGVFAAEKFKCL